MNASIQQVIQGTVNKIKEFVSLEYKVLDDAINNDDLRGKIKVLSNGELTFPDSEYEFTITSEEKEESLFFYGIDLKNTKLYCDNDGNISEYVVLKHDFIDYAKDKITVSTDSLKIGDVLNISDNISIFIKDTIVPNSSLPSRKTQTAKCFELEFHIKTKNDINGKNADDVINYLEWLFYSKLMRTVEFEIDVGNGVLKKYNVMMQGDLKYFDSIEAMLNNRQKRIATAKFFFFIKY